MTTAMSLSSILESIKNNQLTKSHFDSQVKVLNNKLEAQENKLIELEKRILKVENIPNDISATDILKDSFDVEQRKKNIIIFGIEEELRNNRRKTHAAEKERIHQLLEDMQIQHQDFKMKLQRLGNKPNPGTKAKPRPLRIQFSSITNRNSIFANASKLDGNNHWKGISITPDLTKAQRNISKTHINKLMAIAAQRNAQLSKSDINKNIEWKVKGQYSLGNLRLLKTKSFSKNRNINCMEYG